MMPLQVPWIDAAFLENGVLADPLSLYSQNLASDRANSSRIC